jgi:hypothetical protein
MCLVPKTLNNIRTATAGSRNAYKAALNCPLTISLHCIQNLEFSSTVLNQHSHDEGQLHALCADQLGGADNKRICKTTIILTSLICSRLRESAEYIAVDLRPGFAFCEQSHLNATQHQCLIAQAQDDPLEEALVNDPDATAYSRLIASLKLRADETKTVGTLFVPTDRVSCFQPSAFSLN